MKCMCSCVRACLCVSVYACVNLVFRPFILLAIKKGVDYLFHSFVNEVIMRCFFYTYGKHCNMVGPVFTPVTHIIKMLPLRKKDALWYGFHHTILQHMCAFVFTVHACMYIDDMLS